VTRAKRSKQGKCRSLSNYVQRMLREARKAAAPVDDQAAPIGALRLDACSLAAAVS